MAQETTKAPVVTETEKAVNKTHETFEKQKRIYVEFQNDEDKTQYLLVAKEDFDQAQNLEDLKKKGKVVDTAAALPHLQKLAVKTNRVAKKIEKRVTESKADLVAEVEQANLDDFKSVDSKIAKQNLKKLGLSPFLRALYHKVNQKTKENVARLGVINSFLKNGTVYASNQAGEIIGVKGKAWQEDVPTDAADLPADYVVKVAVIDYKITKEKILKHHLKVETIDAATLKMYEVAIAEIPGSKTPVVIVRGGPEPVIAKPLPPPEVEVQHPSSKVEVIVIRTFENKDSASEDKGIGKIGALAEIPNMIDRALFTAETRQDNLYHPPVYKFNETGEKEVVRDSETLDAAEHVSIEVDDQKLEFKLLEALTEADNEAVEDREEELLNPKLSLALLAAGELTEDGEFINPEKSWKEVLDTARQHFKLNVLPTIKDGAIYIPREEGFTDAYKITIDEFSLGSWPEKIARLALLLAPFLGLSIPLGVIGGTALALRGAIDFDKTDPATVKKIEQDLKEIEGLEVELTPEEKAVLSQLIEKGTLPFNLGSKLVNFPVQIRHKTLPIITGAAKGGSRKFGADVEGSGQKPISSNAPVDTF